MYITQQYIHQKIYLSFDTLKQKSYILYLHIIPVNYHLFNEKMNDTVLLTSLVERKQIEQNKKVVSLDLIDLYQTKSE